MLADKGQSRPLAGLRDGLHQPAEQFCKLIAFVAKLLPEWRNDPKRSEAFAEDALSDQLCDYLNAKSRLQPSYDSFQFQRETRDDDSPSRNLDITAKPAGASIVVSGRTYSIYDIFLPIECKRLPTPNGETRDEREYLFDQHRSGGGGVQRFKLGHHGANHTVAAMIGYIQEHDIPHWSDKIAGWIGGLIAAPTPLWNMMDAIALEKHDKPQRLAILRSRNNRSNDLPDVDLHHIWIEMN